MRDTDDIVCRTQNTGMIAGLGQVSLAYIHTLSQWLEVCLLQYVGM